MNKQINVIELFAGAGSFTLGLRNKNINYNLLAYSEIRKPQSKVYSLLHNISEELNKGDVKKFDGEPYKDIVDVIFHGSPCTSLTRAGKMKGADKGSETESSLMWQTVRIVGECRPKLVVWENVPDLTAEKNIHNFKEYLHDMNELGYNNYYQKMNGREYGSAQKRERMFVVSINKEVDDNKFEFPHKLNEHKPLMSYLEYYDNKYDVPYGRVLEYLWLGKCEEGYKIYNNTKQGYLIAQEGDGIDWGFPTSKTRRGRVQKKSCHTFTTSKGIGTIKNGKPVYLSPREYLLLQEFSKNDCDKIDSLGLLDSQIYQIAGNSINIKVLESLYEELFIKRNYID